MSALQRFEELGAGEETDPIERLRAFCSLAMCGDDWLDVEPFFDALAALRQRAEAAEADAERYRWLRANRLLPDAGSWYLSLPVYAEVEDGPAALDAAIDAARKP